MNEVCLFSGWQIRVSSAGAAQPVGDVVPVGFGLGFNLCSAHRAGLRGVPFPYLHELWHALRRTDETRINTEDCA